MLHYLYIKNDAEYHQLVIPQVNHTAVLQTIQNDYGHQGMNQTLSLAHNRFHWSAMYQDVSDFVTNFPWF